MARYKLTMPFVCLFFLRRNGAQLAIFDGWCTECEQSLGMNQGLKLIHKKISGLATILVSRRQSVGHCFLTSLRVHILHVSHTGWLKNHSILFVCYILFCLWLCCGISLLSTSLNLQRERLQSKPLQCARLLSKNYLGAALVSLLLLWRLFFAL